MKSLLIAMIIFMAIVQCLAVDDFYHIAFNFNENTPNYETLVSRYDTVMTVNTTMTDDGYSIYDPDYFSDNTFRSERFITEQLGMVDTTNDTVFVVHFYPTYTDSTETSKVKTIIPWKFDFAWKN